MGVSVAEAKIYCLAFSAKNKGGREKNLPYLCKLLYLLYWTQMIV